jgi:hypothetical protein
MIYNIFIYTISIILFSFSFSGIGKFFLKYFSLKNSSFLIEILYGIYFCSFIVLIYNFLFKINIFFSYLLFFFGLINYFLIKIRKNDLLNDFRLCLILIFFSSLLTFFSKFQEDFPWYTLPYISLLNENKIIFGLTNIQFRFGHTSILSYAAAYSSNVILLQNLIIPYILSCTVVLVYFLIETVKKKNNFKIKLFSFLISSYCLLKFTRFEEFGNDIPAQFLFFYIVFQLINFDFIKDQKNLVSQAFLIQFLIFQKLTMLPVILIIFLILKNLSYKNIITFVYISLFCSMIWFCKNIVNTGCLIYPVDSTCFKNLNWTSQENKHGNPKDISIQSEAWSKAWIDQTGDIKNYKEYVDDYKWIKIWSKKNLKLIFEKLLPLFIFFTILLYFSKKNIINLKRKYQNTDIFLILMSFFSILIWFFNYPIFRYGSGFFVIFLILCFSNYFYSKQLIVTDSILKNILCVALVFFVTKNILRINNNYEIYKDYPLPKLFSETDNFIKDYYILLDSSEIRIIYPKDNKACYYATNICTHHNEIKNNLEIYRNKYGYIFFKNK